MLVLEPFRYLFMFPLSYKHPQGQADLHCVFMKPHSHSSTCDRKVAGGEEPSAAELDLKQVPEGWRWVVVRWWRCCAIWRSLSCVCCVCAVLCFVSFFIWNFLSFLCWRERYSLSIEALFQCYQVSEALLVLLSWWNFPIFSAPQNFSPILLQHRHCLPGCLSGSLPDRDLFEQMVCIWHISDIS